MFHVVSSTWSNFSEWWVYSNEAHIWMSWMSKFLLSVQLWRLFTKHFSSVLAFTVNGMCRHDNMSYLEKLKNSVLLLDRNLEDKVCSSTSAFWLLSVWLQVDSFKLDWQPSVDAVINHAPWHFKAYFQLPCCPELFVYWHMKLCILGHNRMW